MASSPVFLCFLAFVALGAFFAQSAPASPSGAGAVEDDWQELVRYLAAERPAMKRSRKFPISHNTRLGFPPSSRLIFPPF